MIIYCTAISNHLTLLLIISNDERDNEQSKRENYGYGSRSTGVFKGIY